MGSNLEGLAVGKYVLGDLLGKGSMGTVYRARGPAGAPVAVKLLHLVEPRAVARFQREIRIGMDLDHPRVVRFLDSGELDGTLYVVMEFVEGKTVQEILAARGRFPGGLVLELADQLAEGLDALHARDLTHRDLKPANLMIRTDGSLKIMDLGLARSPSLEEITRAGSMVGTPAFMSPEQVKGEDPSPSMDLFAFGLLLFHVLTGRHAFRREDYTDLLPYLQNLLGNPPAVWHEGSEGGPMDRFFRRALAQDPGARFEDATAVAGAFRRALSEERSLHGFAS